MGITGKTKRIIDVLKAFDPLFWNFYPWLAGQYDPNYGGFYYAASSKPRAHGGEAPEFQPDIESTGQAVHILGNSNLLQQMPGEMRRRLISFFQKRQTPEGYFYDPHNNMRTIERMVGRALMYSSTSLEMLGAQPLYPLPGSKENRATLPEHLKSLTALEKWVGERPWHNAWMACDNIQASSVYLRAMPPDEAGKYARFICNYLLEHQDPQTGLWGEGRPYVKISGAFKLALFYRDIGEPIPKAELIYYSLLETLRHDISEDMCWTRNPIDLLLVLRKQLGPYPEADLLEILTITYQNLKQYLKPDGGFSRHVDRSLPIPNNVLLGKGLAEGDMNASTQALRIRKSAYEVSGQMEKMNFLEQYTRGFYDKLSY
ncbi:MAG: hypothetical protein K6U80_03610 [Firmicutes bacterium]|nr:hypothetical protein [Bacillota bacterium]